MKNHFILLFSSLFILLNTQAQDSYIDPNPHPEIQPADFEAALMTADMVAWEAHFEKNYFSQGKTIKDMKGTGYYPYLRKKHFYEMRATQEGYAYQEMWESYKKSKQSLLEKDDNTLAANWQTLGPSTMGSHAGRMIALTFDPFDTNILWTGAASGGLWKSENGGESWQPAADQIPSVGIGAIAINGQNTKSMLIGTGEPYIVNTISRPGIGVLKSSDGGLTWDQTNFAYPIGSQVSSHKIVWDIVDTTNVYMAATNGLWISRDGGTNWLPKFPNEATDILIHPLQSNILYTAILGDGVYKSIDSGENWAKLTNGLPTDPTLVHDTRIAICANMPNVLYTTMVQNTTFDQLGLFKTTDGGDTWTAIGMALDPYCPPFSTPGIVYNCQGWYNNAIAVSPSNPDLLLIGGITLQRSDDGGLTWTQHDMYADGGITTPSNPGRTYVDQHQLVFDPYQPDVIYAVNDGGIAKSENGGMFWNRVNEGLQTAQFMKIAISPNDPSITIGGLWDHGTYGNKMTSPDDLEWEFWGAWDGVDVNIHPDNSNILYGTWFLGNHIKTTTGLDIYDTYFINNGLDFTGETFPAFLKTRMSPFDGDILYTCSNQSVYKTDNGGTLWQKKTAIPNGKVLGVDKIHPNIAYLGAYNGSSWQFWRTEDTGETWQQTPQAPGWRMTDIESDPSNPGVLYVTRNSAFVGNPHVYKSTDYGDSWTPLIAPSLPDIPVNAIAIHPHNGDYLYVATDLGVYISTDGGLQWTEYNDNLPVTFVMDIEFQPADTTLRIGTLGRGVWQTKAYTADQLPTGMDTPNPFFDTPLIAGIYPNPASSEVSIRFDLAQHSEVKLMIFNQLGQVVNTLFEGEMTQGEQALTWDRTNSYGSRVSGGIYFVRLVVGGVGQTVKVVVE